MATIPQTAWQEAGRVVQSWRRPVLLSHVRADGDALGSLLGLARLLRARGAAPIVAVFDEPAARYAELVRGETLAQWDGAMPADADGVVVLDTCSWAQLDPAAAALRTSPLPRVVVDHHATRDHLTQPGAGPVLHERIDESASACALLVYEWAVAMGWSISAGAAEALFVGVATDTGWFRFSNTDARTLRAAAALLDAGVRADRWYTLMYESASIARTRLEGAMLAAAQTTDDGRVVWSTLTQAMFDQAGAARTETEDLIHGLQRIAGTVVALLFVEEPDGRVRASLRSRPPHVCGHDVDVAAIAAPFGGGGHARAAGARLTCPMDDAHRRVLDAVQAALAR